MKNLILVALGIIIGLLGVLFIAQDVIGPGNDTVDRDEYVNRNVVTNFEECVNAGNPVMESFPRQCRHNGELFVEEIDIEDRPFLDDSGAVDFNDCVDKGGTVSRSIPRICIDSEGTSHTEPEQENVAVECTPESRLAEACIQIYAPVCGNVRVECFTEPCNPVPETFSNSCEACRNSRVLSYTEGECS